MRQGGVRGSCGETAKDAVTTCFGEQMLDRGGVREVGSLAGERLTQDTIVMCPKVDTAVRQIRAPKATCVSDHHRNHAMTTDIIQEGEDIGFGCI